MGKFMEKRDCAALGLCYGRLAKICGPKIANPGRYSNALNLPLYGYVMLRNEAKRRGLLTAEEAKEQDDALRDVRYENLQADREGQTAFSMWYYIGLSGKNFSAGE